MQFCDYDGLVANKRYIVASKMCKYGLKDKKRKKITAP